MAGFHGRLHYQNSREDRIRATESKDEQRGDNLAEILRDSDIASIIAQSPAGENKRAGVRYADRRPFPISDFFGRQSGRGIFLYFRVCFLHFAFGGFFCRRKFPELGLACLGRGLFERALLFGG